MKTIINSILKAVIAAAFVMPMMTSCFDDSKLWDSINKIEHRLDSLENSLNKQFQALNSLIDSKTTVSSCEKNADGSYDVTLSNGMKFTVLPDGTDFSALVSITEVGGKKCWATYDASGSLVMLKDPSGNPVPVIKDEYRTKVEVLVEDGKYYLVIDGNKYMTGYDTEDMVQVFSSCTPHKDASGNVYAMTFTFGEGMNITVAVDGYTGVIFRLPNATGEARILTEYFISYGAKESVLLDMEGVVDYVMQIPDGWRVAERTDEYTKERYLDITAPSAELISTGAAAASGDLKVMALVEGGKAAVTKLVLSAEPFKVFNISGARAIIEPYVGVQKYVYGLCLSSEFNESALIETITSLITTNMDIPAGFGVTETGINKTHTEIYGQEMDTDKSYTFWAIPALYKEGSDGGFYVKEGLFCKYKLSPVTAAITAEKVSLLDADISVTIDGTTSFYGGTSLKSETLLDDIIYQINNGIIEPVSTPLSYKGTASAFPSASANSETEFLPSTTYVTWVVPVEEEKSVYSESDIEVLEFTTPGITSGGTTTVTCSEPQTDITTISIPVESEGSVLFYYTFFDKKKGDWNSSLSNDEKVKVIMNDPGCTVVKVSHETKASAPAINATVSRVKPNTEMWLYIVGVDNSGKYGEVKIQTAKTDVLEYNNLTVTIENSELGATDAAFKVNVSGGSATEFIYWFGKATDGFWANSEYMAGTKETAAEYMASYPDDPNIISSMKAHGQIAENGILNVSNLNVKTNYVLMVLAKDASGKWSRGGYKMITTLAADLGTIVREGSNTWNQAKSQVNIKWIENAFEKAEGSFGFASYAYDFSCPKNLTAFIVSSVSDFYQNNSDFLTVEDVIIDLETRAGKYSEKGGTPTYVDDKGNTQLVEEPVWYDNDGNERGGFLMNIFDFYVHGYPKEGYVTYFAEGSHKEGNCISWDKKANGCSGYQTALAKINKLRSLDYWTEYIKDFRNLTNAESIRKSGESYYNGYYPYYKDSEPLIYSNNGDSIRLINPYAGGPDDDGVIKDAVIVVLKDLQGNYYEPMYFPVPDYFTK